MLFEADGVAFQQMGSQLLWEPAIGNPRKELTCRFRICSLPALKLAAGFLIGIDGDIDIDIHIDMQMVLYLMCVSTLTLLSKELAASSL